VGYRADPGLFYSTSKAALNMLMVYYANILKENGFKVNASYSAHNGMDLNSYCGTGTVDEGAANLARLAPNPEFSRRPKGLGRGSLVHGISWMQVVNI
jgi:NAD(P)-dependent dehydrogenase (short-subunit alcohol dehydrogenase family)